MFVVFLAGGIASGKSTVARALAELGAQRIDLDELSREATCAGSAVNARLAAEFGDDVLDSAAGVLRRGVLAERAFASRERTEALERIVHPAIRQLLRERIEDAAARDVAVVVVEIPLLNKVEDLLPMADEVVCVTCPVEVRRERAVGRGMRAEDFDARVRQQPSDDYLARKAHVHLRNDGTADDLLALVRDWWERHERTDWGRR